jgi:single-stranded DNA-specific DHH superfamily exonuclease
LKGNWFEAECVLVGLLRCDPRDVDAGLMLATLFRHTGRLDEAARQLDSVERFDEAAKWIVEIDRERQWLAQAPEEPSVETVESNNGD